MADKNGNSSANLGFEDQLWKAADALRSNMDAAEYKHVVLGLIFLKYISDAFEEQHALLEADVAQGADPEDPDEYRAVNIFWVPKEARWSYLLANAKQPTIGKTVDDAMLAIERDNPSLKGVLPKDYAHPRLDKQRLGQLIDMIGNIGLGDKANRLEGHPRPRLRVLPLPVRQRRGQEGRPVLHAAVHRAACWSPCSRPTAAASTTLAAAPAACSSNREKFIEEHGGRSRRHQRLRPGVQPHHLASGEDEPGDPRHRRQPGAGARR